MSGEDAFCAASALDQPLAVTTFSDQEARAKAQHMMTLRQVADLVRSTSAVAKGKLPWLKLCEFGDKRTAAGSLRHNANVVAVHGIEADYDGEQIAVEQARTVLEGAGIAALIYSSPSHTPERPRWRILCPLSKPYAPDCRSPFLARLQGLFAGALAGESFTLSQAFYYGNIATRPACVVAYADGRFLDLADELDAGARDRKGKLLGKSAGDGSAEATEIAGPDDIEEGWQSPLRSTPAEPVAEVSDAAGSTDAECLDARKRAYLASALDKACAMIANAPDGQKHKTVRNQAFGIGGLVPEGLNEQEALAALRSALAVLLPQCKDQAKARRTLETSFVQGMQKPRSIPESGFCTITDAGLALFEGLQRRPWREEAEQAVAVGEDSATVEAWTDRTMEAREAPPIGLEPDDQDDVEVEEAEDASYDRPRPGEDEVERLCRNAGGVMGEFLAWCERTAIRRQPFLWLSTIIPAVGAFAGRRYEGPTGLRTNFYTVGIADSGAGKDHARKLIEKAAVQAGVTKYLGGTSLPSGAGVRTALMRHPSQIMLLDEFGDVLGAMTGEKAYPAQKQVATLLKELFSSASSLLRGAEYADQTKAGRPREDICEPCMGLSGVTTPLQFWRSIGEAQIHDGLLPRFLVFQVPRSYPTPDYDPAHEAPPASIVEAFKSITRGVYVPAWHGGQGENPGGNLADSMLATVPADAYRVPQTTEAKGVFAAAGSEVERELRRREGTWGTAVLARVIENAMKLALIRAVSRCPKDPTIEVEDAEWGCALSIYCANTMLQEGATQVSDGSVYAVRSAKVLSILTKSGRPMTARDLHRAGAKWHWKLDFIPLLESMVAAGELVAIAPLPGAVGKPGLKYMPAGRRPGREVGIRSDRGWRIREQTTR
jgi:hypothetical protein